MKKWFVCVAMLSGCASSTPAPTPKPKQAAEDDLSWLEPVDPCPADVAPATPKPYHDVDCGQTVSECLEVCRDGIAEACFITALTLQNNGEPDVAEALFLHACRLGHASACTNRAAAIFDHGKADEDGLRCGARTFERTCGWKDPWGCTMFGIALMNGMGVAADATRARAAFESACREAPDSDPCKVATEQSTQPD